MMVSFYSISRVTTFSTLLIIALFSSIILVQSGCTGSVKSSDGYDAGKKTNPADSLLKKDVQAIVDTINAGIMSKRMPPYRFHYADGAATDSIDYWVENDEPARISGDFKRADSTEVWPTFFVRNDSLHFVRFRYMNKTASGFVAKEHMIYLKNEKPVFCDERSVDLLPGQPPGLLREIPYKISDRTFGEIENEYLPYWKKIKSAADANWKEIKPSLKQ